MKGALTNYVRFFVILFWVLFFVHAYWFELNTSESSSMETVVTTTENWNNGNNITNVKLNQWNDIIENNFFIKAWENAMISFPYKLKEIHFSRNYDFNIKTLSGSTWETILSSEVSHYSPLRGYFVNNYGNEDLVISYKTKEKIRWEEKIIKQSFSKWWNLVWFTNNNAQKISIKLDSLNSSENYEKILDFTSDIFWENQNTLKFWNVRSTAEKSNFSNKYVQKNKAYAVYLMENSSFTGSQSATNSDGSVYNQTLAVPVLDLWDNETDKVIKVGQNNSIFDFQIKSGSGSDIFLKNISIYNSGSLSFSENSNILDSVELLNSTGTVLSTLSWEILNNTSFDFPLSDYELLKDNSEIFSLKLNTNPSFTGSVDFWFWIKEIIAEDIDYNPITNLQHSSLESHYWFGNTVTVKALNKWSIELTQTWAINDEDKILVGSENMEILEYTVDVKNERINIGEIEVTYTGSYENLSDLLYTSQFNINDIRWHWSYNKNNLNNTEKFSNVYLDSWTNTIKIKIAAAHIWFEKTGQSINDLQIEKIEFKNITWANSWETISNFVINDINSKISIVWAKLIWYSTVQFNSGNAKIHLESNYWDITHPEGTNTQSWSTNPPNIIIQKMVFENRWNAWADEYTLRKEWELSFLTWSLVDGKIEFDFNNFENNSFNTNTIFEISPEWNSDKTYGLILKKDWIHYSTDADNTGIIFQSDLHSDMDLGTKIY